MTTTELESFLHSQIPITKALAVRVTTADEARVELRASLKPNLNHLGTAFGGSLAAVAILAGYAWIFQALEIRGYKVHVILKSSQTNYLSPVAEDLRAVCLAPAKEDFEKADSIVREEGCGSFASRLDDRNDRWERLAALRESTFLSVSTRSENVRDGRQAFAETLKDRESAESALKQEISNFSGSESPRR